MDFVPFDTRHYQTLDVREGYNEWAETYEETVIDLLDWRLLDHLQNVDWPAAKRVADLACGTGRTGQWLKRVGVGTLQGVDFAENMLARAEKKGVYDRLVRADVTACGLESGAYDLVTIALADEHFQDLPPLYQEAARLTRTGGAFVLVGYHPHFLMMGIPTHFDRSPGESVAIRAHVHLTSDHIRAGLAAGFHLNEMAEGVVDEAWAALKPKWAAKYRHHPVSFALAWRRV